VDARIAGAGTANRSGKEECQWKHGRRYGKHRLRVSAEVRSDGALTERQIRSAVGKGVLGCRFVRCRTPVIVGRGVVGLPLKTRSVVVLGGVGDCRFAH
jgi:hypothetical protein